MQATALGIGALLVTLTAGTLWIRALRRVVLPAPTSMLVDADGKVLWMDQSENYQRRSDPDYVLAALRRSL
ncbi:MAG: hypothetical protein HOC23_22210 [Halieaceae bacterium]|jgi:hypothetical protein|nr:hypothetical protein [Halieaceae bacterium]